MRPLPDGTYTPCYAKEENVGKRRCKHLGGDDVKFEVKINKVDAHVKEVIISDEYEELDKKDRLEVIGKFISTLQPIDQEEVDSVLDVLRKTV